MRLDEPESLHGVRCYPLRLMNVGRSIYTVEKLLSVIFLSWLNMIESETEIAMIIGLPIVSADVHLVPTAFYNAEEVVRVINFTLRGHRVTQRSRSEILHALNVEEGRLHQILLIKNTDIRLRLF